MVNYEGDIFEEHRFAKWDDNLKQILLSHPNVKEIEEYHVADACFAHARPATAMVFLEDDGTVGFIKKGDPSETWEET